jgi:hypothetical protein
MPHAQHPAAAPANPEVAALVARARAAQAIANGYDQERVDELVAAAGWAMHQGENGLLTAAHPHHDLGNAPLAQQSCRGAALGIVPRLGVLAFFNVQPRTKGRSRAL